jgi:hypothetical protein
MKIKLTITAFLSLFVLNCAFKDNVKRQTVGGTQMVIYEATEVALFKNVNIKTIKPTCLNGIKKAGASKVTGLTEDPYAVHLKVFTSSSQQSSQDSIDSSRASSTTAPTYVLRCSAIGVE